MVDIATLTYKVDSSGLAVAEKRLDSHTKAAKRTETASQKVANSYDEMDKRAKRATRGMGSLNREVDQLARGLRTGNVGSVNMALASLGQRAMFAAGAMGLLAGAGFAALAIYDRGARELRRFEGSLILTGNAAETTAQSLANLAGELDGLAGVTTARAAKAIAQVGQVGRFTRAEIEMVSEAAIKWQQATGQSVEATVQQFRRLQKDPVRALLDLNEQMNFLTPATLEAVRALDEAGNHADAAALATRTYADTINTRAPQITENLGLIERGWRGVKSAATEAWDAMLSVGREPTSSALSTSLQQWESMLRTMPGDASASPMQIAQRRRLEREIAQARTQLAERGVSEGLAFGASAGIVDSDAERRADDARAQDRFFSRMRGGGMGDLTSGAIRELQQLAEAEANAREQFEARAASLSGPAAEASYRYAVELQRLRDLAGEGGIAASVLAEAEANLARQHEANMEAIERRLNPAARMLEQMDFEIRLMGMSNAERELAIQLRHLDVEATDKQIAALRRLIEEREANMELIDMMDGIRHAGSDLMTDWATGAKSFGDALEGSLKRVQRQLVQMAMDQWIQKLMGGFGTTGGGAWGDALAGLFGGGRRHGGPVRGDRLYQVGEGNQPELLRTSGGQYLIPGDQGRVEPMGHTAPAARGSSAPMQVIVNNNAPNARVEAREERYPAPDGSELRRLVVNVVAEDLANGGATAAAGKGRFGWKEML